MFVYAKFLFVGIFFVHVRADFGVSRMLPKRSCEECVPSQDSWDINTTAQVSVTVEELKSAMKSLGFDATQTYSGSSAAEMTCARGTPTHVSRCTYTPHHTIYIRALHIIYVTF